MNTVNPFVYDAANTLDDDLLLEYYVDDFNNNRLIRSNRNVIVIGERGSGKTMSLLYNSIRLQRRLLEIRGETVTFEYVGVVIPCNTPLTHRQDHGLLTPFQASKLAEHYLATSIAHAIVSSIGGIPELCSAEQAKSLREALGFAIDLEIPNGDNIFHDIARAVDRENIKAQRMINEENRETLYPNAASFHSLVLPLLRVLREEVKELGSTHFLLMMDDVHDLNDYQTRVVNSWLAFRERSLFSFKLATAKTVQPHQYTASGGTILEGHDFVTIDFEKPMYSPDSTYGRLAKKIIERRLSKSGVTKTVDEFFPEHRSLLKDLQDIDDDIRAKTSHLTGKALSDYVYKQRWALYIRNRPPKANLPLYSGFDTLSFLSTGVIRNLLEPCWWLFDDQLSQNNGAPVTFIDPNIQAARIIERSKFAWERLRRVDRTVEGCTAEMGEQIFSMFTELAAFFLQRLMTHASEPSATSFSLSERGSEAFKRLVPLLEVTQRAQLMYTREGSAKDRGRREVYYVPNRMLWPSRYLDPHGQHSRVSIKATDLWNACLGHKIPSKPNPNIESAAPTQGELF